MGTAYTDRVWLAGGALGAVVLVAVGWFLLISPQNGRTAAVDAQAAVARTQQLTLQHRLAELQRQNADLADYQAQLAAAQAALPSQADLTTFLRDLQSGDRSHSVVSGVTIGAPQEVPGKNIFALQLTLTTNGSAAQLNGLLDYLQQVQPRAVLIKNLALAGTNSDALGSGSATLTVSLQVFVLAGNATTGTAPGAAPAATPR
jgi:Tfp pilus assembly protein PilO